MSAKCKLSQKYTNHCIHVTGTTNLIRAHFNAKQIMSVTGHKSMHSLGVYQRISSMEKLKMGMSLCFSLVHPEQAKQMKIMIKGQIEQNKETLPLEYTAFEFEEETDANTENNITPPKRNPNTTNQQVPDPAVTMPPQNQPQKQQMAPVAVSVQPNSDENVPQPYALDPNVKQLLPLEGALQPHTHLQTNNQKTKFLTLILAKCYKNSTMITMTKCWWQKVNNMISNPQQ